MLLNIKEVKIYSNTVRNINPKPFSLSTEPPFFYFYLKIGLLKNLDTSHDALYKQGAYFIVVGLCYQIT